MSFDRKNKNDAELCHHVGCRKHKRLTDTNGGRFCKEHVKQIKIIREGVTHDLTRQEMTARMNEMLSRKELCNGHLDYLWKLNEYLAEAGTIEYNDYIGNMKLINDFIDGYQYDHYIDWGRYST